MSAPGSNPSTEQAPAVQDERVVSPARDLIRLSETRPDGRRLTRYQREPDEQ